MRLEVLISCMHEKDHSIVERTNIQTDVIVVNQCDKDLVEEYSFINKKGKECNVKFINSTERGLSRSRNMALRNASADLCLICDDDEELNNDYEDIIINAFQKTPSADLIAFNIKRPNKKPFDSVHKLGYIESLKVSSVHIAFRLQRVLEKKISFDEMLGSGTGNGGGEDTRFMRDCRNKGLSLWSNDLFIGILKNTGESQWFHGYNKQFFIDSGWASRRIYGDAFSVVKLVHYAIKHWGSYHKDISLIDAVRYSFEGWRMKK